MEGNVTKTVGVSHSLAGFIPCSVNMIARNLVFSLKGCISCHIYKSHSVKIYRIRVAVLAKEHVFIRNQP